MCYAEHEQHEEGPGAQRNHALEQVVDLVDVVLRQQEEIHDVPRRRTAFHVKRIRSDISEVCHAECSVCGQRNERGGKEEEQTFPFHLPR